MKCILLALLAAAPALGRAQAPADSLANGKAVELTEVTVKARRVVKTADGLKLFPTPEQIEAAADGYDLLKRLALPHVRIDEVMHTIEANELIGAVQVRIDGIVAAEHELMSLEMAAVRSIDVIERPGMRYGEGVGMVVNIHTRRAVAGWLAGGSVLQSATTLYNRSAAYVKLNRGRHELAADYSLGVSDWGESYTTEAADYTLADGSHHTVSRRNQTDREMNYSHAVALKYSLVEPSRYSLQVALSGRFHRVPEAGKTRTESFSTGTSLLTKLTSHSDAATPQLDVYFSTDLPRGQSLTANAVCSYQAETYSNRHRSPSSAYAYEVDSRIRSLAAEAVYEKRWKPLALSAGGRFSQLYSNDEYTGDIASLSILHRSQAYLYAQLSGQAGCFFYKGSVGYDGLWGRQSGRRYAYHQFIPKASVGCHLGDAFTLAYDFSMRQDAPRLALVNDITAKRNELEYEAGNPDLAPRKRYEHTLTASFSRERVRSHLAAMYRMNLHTWMDEVTRTADGKFVFTKRSKGDINMLYLSDYTTFSLLPGKLDLTLEWTFVRSFNLADTYTHCYSAWMGGVDVQAYLGRCTLSAHADNGWRYMEGESKGRNGSTLLLAAGCRLGKWGNLTLMWQNPLDKEHTGQRSWLLNPMVRKDFTACSPALGNMVSVRLTVNLSRGRRFQGIRKAMDNSAVESTSVKVK